MSNKRNLKIAILGTRGMPAKYGGYETVAERLSVGLDKLGVNVTVFCPSNNDYKKYMFDGVNLRFVKNLEKHFGVVGTLLYDLLSSIKSAFLDFNIVYMLGYSSAIFYIIPHIFGKKIVINTDGMEWKRSKWVGFARLFLKFNEFISTKVSNVLIADSVEIKKYFNDKYGVNSIYIAYGGDLFYSKDKSFIGNIGLHPSEYYLVVARLEPENNIHTIIKGFSSTKTKKKLVLVTNMKESRYFYQIKKLCEKDKRIILFGPLYDRRKLNELRANAFAYIHGHSVGGTNPSLLESMGCGNVVIAFDVPFNREVLRNNGYFFKNDYEIKKIVEFLEKFNKNRIINMGNKNRKTIETYYNWKKVVLEYFDFFKSLVS